MFKHQLAAFPDAFVVTWAEPLPHESLREYSLRMADTVPRNRPIVLCGVSFGGMIALEMAEKLNAAGVVLSGACYSSRQIHWYLRPTAYIIAAVPVWVGEHARWLSRGAGWLVGPLGKDERRSIAVMTREALVKLVTWGFLAIVLWPGKPKPTIPVIQVHGECDRIIPVRRVNPDVVVPGAGHLLNMTHPGPVNDAIARMLATVSLTSTQVAIEAAGTSPSAP
jgi:pimeloyl-ACP methyl ester carboxylesterase